jgi:hypothetical protein
MPIANVRRDGMGNPELQRRIANRRETAPLPDVR